MGYTTDFEGEFNITPPLNQEQVERLNNFSEDRHGGNLTPDPGMPGFWCDWVTNNEGTTLSHNGSEKSYNYEGWLNYLIKNFFRPWGVTVNGRVFWSGEDVRDVGTIIIENNVITLLNGVISEG